MREWELAPCACASVWRVRYSNGSEQKNLQLCPVHAATVFAAIGGGVFDHVNRGLNARGSK